MRNADPGVDSQSREEIRRRTTTLEEEDETVMMLFGSLKLGRKTAKTAQIDFSQLGHLMASVSTNRHDKKSCFSTSACSAE